MIFSTEFRKSVCWMLIHKAMVKQLFSLYHFSRVHIHTDDTFWLGFRKRKVLEQQFDGDSVFIRTELNFLQVSHLIPKNQFKEQLVRVFLKPSDDQDADGKCLQLLMEAFSTWCKNNKMKEPKVCCLLPMDAL